MSTTSGLVIVGSLLTTGEVRGLPVASVVTGLVAGSVVGVVVGEVVDGSVVGVLVVVVRIGVVNKEGSSFVDTVGTIKVGVVGLTVFKLIVWAKAN